MSLHTIEKLLSGTFGYPKTLLHVGNNFFIRSSDGTISEPIPITQNSEKKEEECISLHIIAAEYPYFIYWGNWSLKGIHSINVETKEIKTISNPGGYVTGHYTAVTVVSEKFVLLLPSSGKLQLWDYQKCHFIKQYSPSKPKKVSNIYYNQEIKLLFLFNPDSDFLVCYDFSALKIKEPKFKLKIPLGHISFWPKQILKFITGTSKDSILQEFEKINLVISRIIALGENLSCFCALSEGKIAVGIANYTTGKSEIQILGSDFQFLEKYELKKFNSASLVVQISVKEVLIIPKGHAYLLDLSSKKLEEFNQLGLLDNAITAQPFSKKEIQILRLILITKLKYQLPKDLINEIFSFLV